MSDQRMPLLCLCVLFTVACAGDIKGEKGDPGDPVSSTALLKRPDYRSSGGETTVVRVPAAVDQPAKVFIADRLLVNTEDRTAGFATSGRNGLDSGSTLRKASVYYLYAIPGETSGTFDLVISEQVPSQGPASFSDWSYIGSFRTREAAEEIHPFSASDGVVSSTTDAFQTFSTSTTTFSDADLMVSAIASYILGQLEGTGTGGAVVSADRGKSGFLCTEAPGDRIDVRVPVLDSSALKLKASGGGTATLRVYAWGEEPWRFQ